METTTIELGWGERHILPLPDAVTLVRSTCLATIFSGLEWTQRPNVNHCAVQSARPIVQTVHNKDKEGFICTMCDQLLGKSHA